MRKLRSSIVLCLTLVHCLAALGDALTIISPHRKSIQTELIPSFKEHYQKTYGKKIQVDWIDQGGTESDLRFVLAQFASNPKSSGIDIFWGGGNFTFHDLDERGLLLPYQLPDSLSSKLDFKIAGIETRSPKNTWYASALSSFGIFFNRRLLKLLKIKEPTNWASLAEPTYYDQLSLADPRRSSSSLVMNLIILESLGWEQGWQVLYQQAGNARSFTHSSSDPIKAVVSGEASLATAIDFYAYAKISRLGKKNLGFVLPPSQTIFNADPIAILKGAPNSKEAKRFVNYVLSDEAQRKLVLPVGSGGGPRSTHLGRMAVLRSAYANWPEGVEQVVTNPFTIKNHTFALNVPKIARIKKLVSDLLGAVHIDVHKDLKKAWKGIIDRGLSPQEIELFGKAPISEQEMEKVLAKWDDNVFRNQLINKWITDAKKRYHKLAKQGSV